MFDFYDAIATMWDHNVDDCSARYGNLRLIYFDGVVHSPNYWPFGSRHLQLQAGDGITVQVRDIPIQPSKRIERMRATKRHLRHIDHAHHAGHMHVVLNHLFLPLSESCSVYSCVAT